MTKGRAKLSGQDFEQRAAKLLEAQGLRILATNYHAHRLGEIDIIAHEVRMRRQTAVDCLVFVEVRSRRQGDYADALTSITPSKQRKIIAAAEHFLQAHPEYRDWECRFDVVAFDVMADGEVMGQWLPAAFMT